VSSLTKAAAAAVLALLPWGCARRETGATIVRSSALGALPKESVAVIVLEVKSLRGLQAFARFTEEIASEADREGPLKGLRERFGADLIQKVDRLGLAIVPQPGNAVGYGILAEGSFDEAEMRQALGGGETLSLPTPEGRPDFNIAVLKSGILALGPRQILDVVRANLVRRGSGLDSNRTILDLLAGVRPTAQVWGAADVRTMAQLGREAAAARGLGTALQRSAPPSALVAFAFQGTIGTSVMLDLVGRADGAEGARKLADAARGLVALGRMGAAPGQAADWIAFLDGIAIEQKGTEISLRASVPPSLVSGLAEKARAAAASLPAGP